LPDAIEARNVILSDDKVREFVCAAYAHDEKLGLLVDVLAITGARPSQVVRLRVEDLHDHPVRPKLMMPKSAKGGGRNRSQEKHERYSVPITVLLAAKLREAAKVGDARMIGTGQGSPTSLPEHQGYI
jgi:integrase